MKIFYKKEKTGNGVWIPATGDPLSEYVYRMAEVAFYQAYRMRYGLYVPKYLNDILTW